MEFTLFGAAMRIPYSLLLFVAAMALTAAATPGVMRLARWAGAMDQPGPRRIHEAPTPSWGGLAMAMGVLVVAWGAYVNHGPIQVLDTKPLIGLTLGSLPILALGMVDDRRGAPPWVKLAVQAIAAVILTRFGLGIPAVSLPWGEGVSTGMLNLPLTIVWVVVLTNAINLIDGLDGLAAGVVCIAAMTLWFVGRTHADLYVMFITAPLAGAAVGFLFYNFPPARVFMGDTGSQFLGFTLATLSLIESRKGTTTVTLLFPLVALGVPVLDGAVAFLRRLAHKRPVFAADSEHIHHRLLRIGLSKRSALLVLWYVCAYLGVMAVVLAELPRHYSWFVLALLAMGLYLAFAVLEFVDRRTSHPEDPRDE